MKKKILSILLCLCMVAVLLPTTALADETLESYGYAYDVQRTQLSDNNIKLWGLDAPRNSNGSAEGMQNNGSWTLTKVGTYSYMKSVGKNTNNLDGIVDNVAGAYGISDKNTIVIHELKEESGTDTHIAYGVIIANDQTNGNVLFIGDSLSGRGAGYLLSTTAKTGDVTVTAGMVATDFVEQTPPPSTPVVIIVPDNTADTTDPAKNPETGDNSTHLLWAVMASSALCAAALLFSSRRRGEEMQ